jgi:hypothetical protein
MIYCENFYKCHIVLQYNNFLKNGKTGIKVKKKKCSSSLRNKDDQYRLWFGSQWQKDVLFGNRDHPLS